MYYNPNIQSYTNSPSNTIQTMQTIRANLFFTIALQIHAYEQTQKKKQLTQEHNETSFNTILNLHARNTLLFNLILFLYDATTSFSAEQTKCI